MSQIKNIGDTLPKNTSTTTSKLNFANDVAKVLFTLPVKFDSSFVLIHFKDSDGKSVGKYSFDCIPNVDINQYIQFAVHLYNNGSTSYPAKSF